MSAASTRPSWWHLLSLLALSAAYESLFLEHSNGELFDEGWPLKAAGQLHAGGLLYREAFFTFPPGHVLPAWIATALDPPGIWLSRLFYAGFNVALVAALYGLGCRLMPRRFAFWGALAVALAAPHSHLGHLLFGYRYLVFSVLALLALARGIEAAPTGARPGVASAARCWLWAGLWTGVALTFRLTPAFSVACGVAAALFWARPTLGERLRAGGVYALGIALPLLPVLLWLGASVGLDVVWRETVVRVIGLQSAQSLPIPSLSLPGGGDRAGLHAWFVALQYWGAVALYAGYALHFVLRAVRAGRRRNPADALLLAVVVWGGVFLLRTLGRSDDHHLNSALPPLLLLGAHFGASLFGRYWEGRPARSAKSRGRIENAACAAALVAALFAQGIDRHFDPFDRGLVPMRAAGAGNPLKPTVEALEIERLVGILRERTGPDETILDVSASPLLYVLADRRSPGGFDLFMPGTFLDAAEERAFVERLDGAPPALVVWPGWPFDNQRERSLQRTAPLLARWILEHYAPLDARSQSHRFVILAPRESPGKPLEKPLRKPLEKPSNGR
jgi:hypothetical protein